MRLKIDLQIPNWTKWLVAGTAIGVVLGVGASRVYADVTVPKSWTARDLLKAEDLNANFKALQDAIDTVIASTAPGAKVYAMANGKKYSINATYCGATLATTGAFVQGGLVGYAAAKAVCESTCLSPSAHMCTGEEMIRHVSMGGSVPTGQGWIASSAGVVDSYPARTDGSSLTCYYDCLGYQASAKISCSGGASASFGTIWLGTYFSSLGCDQSAAIYCCD
jgi:hypothetical protein